MIDDLLAKYAEAAVAASKEKLACDHNIPSEAPPQSAPRIEDPILAKYAAAALEARKHKEEKKAQKKEASQYKVPERLTLEKVKTAYSEAGITPSRNFYYFIEGSPCIQAAYLNDDVDRKIGSPFGAMVLAAASKIPTSPSWVIEDSNHWVLGSVSRLTGYSTSYIQGFNSGFDGHAPGHRMCSYDFHCGYADGRIIAALLHQEGALALIESEDPFREVDDRSDLQELIRVQGYWRDEWGPKPPFLTDITDLTAERAQELGLSPDLIGRRGTTIGRLHVC